MTVLLGKARRLKQAKEEAQAEIEAYRQERERQYREHEAKVGMVYIYIYIYMCALFDYIFKHDTSNFLTNLIFFLLSLLVDSWFQG